MTKYVEWKSSITPTMVKFLVVNKGLNIKKPSSPNVYYTDYV